MIEPRWLSVKEVIRLHALQLVEFGGKTGTRDENLLGSAVSRPRQRYSYGELRTLVDIAAAYAAALNANHPFIDGNKRVSFHAALVFLRLHGLSLQATTGEATEMMLALAAGHSGEADVRRWMNDNVRPT
jgi:death-on-curing protein